MTEPCPNCGDPTPGNYCPNCGQRRGERRVTLRRMLAEAIEDQFSLNAALPRTLRALLFRPGLLSTEYINGRIQRYIPPLRLYLATSVVCFLLLSFFTARRTPELRVQGQPLTDSTATIAQLLEQADTAAGAAERVSEMRLSTGWAPLDTVVNQRLRELSLLPAPEAARTVTRLMLQRAPTAVFLMLPLFALLLQVLYFRARRYYVEHFVFALHTHAFLFVLFTIMLLASALPLAAPVLVLWQALYGYLALRRYYGQGWFRTLLKYGVLGVAYSVLLGFAGLFTVVVGLVLS